MSANPFPEVNNMNGARIAKERLYDKSVTLSVLKIRAMRKKLRLIIKLAISDVQIG